jgi:hypothetical protein
MDRYIDVLNRTLQLLDTGLEGLEYIKEQMQAGDYESTMVLMQDILVAYSVIERSLSPVLKKLPPNEIEALAGNLRDAFEQMVSIYEKQAWENAETMLLHILLPYYQAWKAELEKQIQPYIVS